MTDNALADKQAEESLRQKIAGGSQNPEDYRNLIDLLFPLGRYDEAIAVYQQALSLPLTDFKKAQLCMELGWLYYSIGQREQSSAFARDALSLLLNEPRTAEVLYCLGASQALLAFCRSYTDANAGAEAARLALEWSEQAIADGSDFEDKPKAYIDAARLHTLVGDTDKAIVHCEKCLAQNINDVDWTDCLVVYAETLRAKERFMEAEQAIAEAFRYGKNYTSGLFPRLYIELAAIQRFTNRLAESKRSLEQALTNLRTDPYFHDDVEILGEIYFNLATTCYELVEYEEAISAYKDVLRYHARETPSYWTALYWLGTVMSLKKITMKHEIATEKWPPPRMLPKMTKR